MVWCPSCGSDYVKRSRARWYDYLWQWTTKRRPYRCLSCSRRFWR
jgi:hypothetical protein